MNNIPPAEQQCTYFESPVGWVQVKASQQGITSVYFVDKSAKQSPGKLVDEAQKQLQAYFAGKLKRFDLPLAANGTDFQRQVWQALTDIDYGDTQSYGQIAKRLNNPKAVRAVGAANGRNPISIIVPCHRVIGANGTLTGYAGGLQRKKWLLELERQHR